MKERQIILNRIQCNHCKDIIVSHSRHDFKWCSCGKVAVDGGTYYQHLTGELEDYTNLAIYSDAPFEEIRKHYERGGRGINGDEPLTWVALCDMNEEWLLACIKYNEERNMGDSFANKMYKKELKFRKNAR